MRLHTLGGCLKSRFSASAHTVIHWRYNFTSKFNILTEVIFYTSKVIFPNLTGGRIMKKSQQQLQFFLLFLKKTARDNNKKTQPTQLKLITFGNQLRFEAIKKEKKIS